MKKTIFIALLVAPLFLQTQIGQAQCHIDDWTALKALYESTNGDDWTFNIGWNVVKSNTPASNCNLGTLYGVALLVNNRVFRLELKENNLKGMLPPEIDRLSSLALLNLHNNNLEGKIPEEIGKLSTLMLLDLSSNNLTGSIPADLGNLNLLGRLDLYENQLSAGIPPALGNLINMQYLNLSNNQLEGTIPQQLGNLKNILYLELHNNNLFGCYSEKLYPFCEYYTNPYGTMGLLGLISISAGNNFDESYENFCTNNFAGLCSTEPLEVPFIKKLSTNYSGRVDVEFTLVSEDNQYLLKNDVVEVLIYNSDCDFDLSKCEAAKRGNSANEVFWATTLAYKYFSEIHEYAIEEPVISVVDKFSANNAIYSNGVITYGEGDGLIRGPMTEPDIIGHEITHHLIETHLKKGELNMWREFGALNESFADIFGELIEYYTNCARDSTKCGNDWIIGSQIPITSYGLRNMANPKDEKMSYQQPNTYKGINWVPAEPGCTAPDNCGIHTNSGVQNYWFYLLANGGSGVNDLGIEYNIVGIGMESAAKIVFRSIIEYLEEGFGYEDVAVSSIKAAKDIFGSYSEEEKQTRAAWIAVGVLEENPIKLKLTDIEISEIDFETRMSPISFRLVVDSLNQDFSGDNSQFTLNSMGNIQDLKVSSIHNSLTWEELDTSKLNSHNTISINRATNEYANIPAGEPIIQMTGCIVELDIGNEPIRRAPIEITGGTFVKGNLNTFSPRTVQISKPSISSDENLQIYPTAIDQKFNVLGSIEIEVYDGEKPFTYKLINAFDDTAIIYYEENLNSKYTRITGLKHGIYGLVVTDRFDRSTGLITIPINYIAPSNGNDYNFCPKKVIVEANENSSGVFRCEGEIEIIGEFGKSKTIEIKICDSVPELAK